MTELEFYISEKSRKWAIEKLKPHFEKKHRILIESGIYNFTEQYCESNNNYLVMASAIYEDCVKNIFFICEQNAQTIQKLKSQIKNDKFNCYNLAFMKPEELNEDNWKKIILRKNTTEDKLTNLPTVQWKACKICKNTEYFYRQEQTRSADEPMTTYYYCKHCPKTYRVNN